MSHLERELLQTILRRLAEDRSRIDRTVCVSSEECVHAQIVLNQGSIVAGLPFLPLIFSNIDPSLTYKIFTTDGKDYPIGTVLASIEGKAHLIRKGERTALNLLQYASGIAYLTSQFVSAIKNFQCSVLSSEKTLPSLRPIQKYALRTGGGSLHPFDKQERFAIQKEHLKSLEQTSARPLFDAIRRAKILQPDAKIEVEVDSLKMLTDALAAKADFIVLENMSSALVQEAVKMTQNRAFLATAGGIHLANVQEYAATGVNAICVGELPYSANAVDIRLKI